MYRVSKILNNNGVIAINTEDNQEYVLLGKGIGFGKKVSQRFEVTEDLPNLWCRRWIRNFWKSQMR